MIGDRIRRAAGRVRGYFSCPLCHGTGYKTERVPVNPADLPPRRLAEMLVLGGPFYREARRPCTHPGDPTPPAGGGGWFWLAYSEDGSTAGAIAPGAWAIVHAADMDDAQAVASAQGTARGKLVLILRLPDDFIPDPAYTDQLFTGAEAERIRMTDPPVYGAWAGAGS